MKNVIKVYYHDRTVGYLEDTHDHLVSFEYDSLWLRDGFSLNPFSLPLKEGVFIPKNNVFNGLFGVFSDSLPDAWGRLLIKRILAKEGIHDSSELFKLTLVSPYSMGALKYKSSDKRKYSLETYLDYDKLSNECQKLLDEKASDDLDVLFKMGGSSGGARPKANILIDGQVYILKFATSLDSKNAGQIEYEYSMCAKECGIDMPSTLLLPSKICSGYFATKRFDIENDERIHMVSVAGLLECDYRSPALDYSELFKLTKILTNNDKHDILQMFRRMCFNVFTHNLDDHAKNFAFLYDERLKRWKLSPAYDLTYSNTYYGGHMTSVNGKGIDISDDDLVEIGLKYGMRREVLVEEIERIHNIVNRNLGKYLV